MDKPSIFDITNGAELRRWYWTKLQLQQMAKRKGVSAVGAKFSILERIANKLDGLPAGESKSATASSRFDWSKESICDDTVITDNYRNSQNVRRYMQSKVPDFAFNISFMEWMKANTGKKMSDAVDYYIILHQKMRRGEYVPEIKAHNQYNKYLRDFSVANPDCSLEDAKRCWKYKTSLPSTDGMHRYEPADLAILSRPV